MAITITENTIQFNFPDSVEADPLYEFNSLHDHYSLINVIMKYSHKGYHTKFKLFFIGEVLTLELYLPKPKGHCFEHNFLVASLDVTSIIGYNYALTDEVIFFGFQDIEYERVYDGIIRYTEYTSLVAGDSSDDEDENDCPWVPPRSDYDMACKFIRDMYVETSTMQLLNSTNFHEICDLFAEFKEEIKDSGYYTIMKRIFKTLRPYFDETKIISGYNLYRCDTTRYNFGTFLVLKAGYDSKEIMSYADFRAAFYKNTCTGWAKMDEHGECSSGFWHSTNKTLRANAFNLQWEHNCKKLYQLPYPHKLLLLTVNIECSFDGLESVRYSNFICHVVETVDNMMIKQYYEDPEAIKFN